MPSVLQINMSEDLSEIRKLVLQAPSDTKYFEVYHPKPEEWTSLIHLSQTDTKSREVLIALSQAGFLVYRAPATGSSFVLRSSVHEVWARIKDGQYCQSADGNVYEFTRPRHAGPIESLVVVMSSVAKNKFTQSLDRHFAPMMSNLSQLVGGHTAVLRIADLDGIVGGYYLPTVRDPKASTRIQELIMTIASNFNVPKDRIVLYGASKGGTGALFNALALDVHSVSVDPITSLTGRDTIETDPYLSGSDIYPAKLDAVFDDAVSSYVPGDTSTKHVIITAPRSKEYARTVRLVMDNPHARLRLIESCDPHILHHHEVSKNTVALTLAMINSFAQGLPIELPVASKVH